MRIEFAANWVLGACAALIVACGTSERPAAVPEHSATPAGPYVVVLGTAQDGGFPQLGAEHARARRAWSEPTRRRLVASLLIVSPRDGRRWLIDASPDIREQVERARRHPPGRQTGPGRPPLFDGIFLSHAHMGHYAGLVHFGREAYGAEQQRVLCSESMAGFLRANAPWELAVSSGHIAIDVIRPDQPVRLSAELTVTPLEVPHRDEYTNTLGFIVRGPGRAVLYIPDIDKWDRWDRRIEAVIAEVDVALLDGTFYANGEIPGRDMATIPHPFIEESLRRFSALPAAERDKVRFTHLNHTNPAVDPDGDAHRAIRAAGCHVAADGEVHPL